MIRTLHNHTADQPVHRKEEPQNSNKTSVRHRGYSFQKLEFPYYIRFLA